MSTDTGSPAASLEFSHVYKRYPGADRTVLSDVSFNLPAGEICVFVGPSGCGKTTATRMINRMVEISEGDILLDGASVRAQSPASLRRAIGYVIQQTGLFPHKNIAENISTVPRLLGWDRKRTAARVQELAELIGLPEDALKRYPAQLSGGQRQRVGVARALAADPPLMLMDEPFGAIDPITRNRLQEEFLRLQQQVRKTIVFVTHDIDEAIKMGDKIGIFSEEGRLVQFDTPNRLLAHPANEFVSNFIGVDRGLRRLTLSRLSDLKLSEAHLVHNGERPDGLRDRLTSVIVDGAGHARARLDQDGKEVALGPTASVDTELRTALSLIIDDGSRPLVVTDDQGTVLGLAELDAIVDRLTVNGTGP